MVINHLRNGMILQVVVPILGSETRQQKGKGVFWLVDQVLGSQPLPSQIRLCFQVGVPNIFPLASHEFVHHYPLRLWKGVHHAHLVTYIFLILPYPPKVSSYRDTKGPRNNYVISLFTYLLGCFNQMCRGGLLFMSGMSDDECFWRGEGGVF